MNAILKQFEKPDETLTFPKGKFEVVNIAGMTLGRASYEPGWRWSEHVGAAHGETSCQVEHVGVVLSGRATAAMDDGTPPGHDSWVIGDEPYVSLHLLGASQYARTDSK